MEFIENMRKTKEYAKEVQFMDGPWFATILNVIGLLAVSAFTVGAFASFSIGDDSRGWVYTVTAALFVIGFGFIAYAQWLIAYLSGKINVREEYALQDAELRLRETYGITG